jgi:iron complex transport system substrate-binding protein
MIHNITKITCFFLLSIILLACNTAGETNDEIKEEVEKEHRIVSLSGAITESLYYMGYGDKVVGVDVTSTFPTEVHSKEKLGHVSSLNTEGILGLNPTIILADANENTNEKLQTLTKAGIDITYIDTDYTLDNAINICNILNQKLGGDKSDVLNELVEVTELSKKAWAKIKMNKTTSPKIMFIYARGPGQMMVGGEKTSAESMFELIGAKNAVSGFDSFQAFSTEGLVEAQPEVILLFESGLKSLGGIEEFLKIQGVDKTPAGIDKRIIAMDGAYLLGFSPRSHQAAIELAHAIYK